MSETPGVVSVMRKLAVVVVVVVTVVALWGGVAASAQAAAGDWYLALGDSLAAGVQSQPSITGGGYPARLAALMQSADRGIQLENLAVPGATTSSFLGGQLTSAEDFLRAHGAHVRLVTIDIGGNDVAGCTPGNSTCLDPAFTRMDSNVTEIVSDLTAAAAPTTRFVMMTYYDPFLEYWVTGSLGRAEAELTLPTVAELNRRLVRDFGPRFLVADVAAAFSTADATDLVSRPVYGSVPMNIGLICWLTGGCADGFNLHANWRGHLLMAQTFFAAITHRPAVPVVLAVPGLSGRAAVGARLTASHGLWTNLPGTFGDRWERCNVTGAGCTAIAGATRASYIIAAADRGHTIRVEESARNDSGHVGSAVSPATKPVPPTTAQIKAQLAADIAPRGRRPTIAAILRAGGPTLSVTAFGPGRTGIRWTAARTGQAPILIATGAATFSAAGVRPVKLRLAPGSRAFLARLTRVSITAAGSFTPVGRGALTATATFALKR